MIEKHLVGSKFTGKHTQTTKPRNSSYNSLSQLLFYHNSANIRKTFVLGIWSERFSKQIPRHLHLPKLHLNFCLNVNVIMNDEWFCGLGAQMVDLVCHGTGYVT